VSTTTPPLSLGERVAARIADLSPSELRVATFLREHQADVAFLSVTELATRLGTSDATVIRTAQALGYAGLPDLRRELIEQLRARMSPAVRLAGSLEHVAESPDAFLDSAFAMQIDLLEQTRRSLKPKSFERAVEILVGAQRVLAFGTGVAGHLAAMFAVRLQRLGHDAQSISATGAGLADTLLTLRDGDALLALVNEHGPKDSRLVLDEAARHRVPIVLLTDTLSGVFARQVSVALVAPRGDATSFKSLATAGVLLDVLLLAIAARQPARSLRAIEDFGRLRSKITGLQLTGDAQATD
jgi:DNA-binding MurR/RpiR family transcriptional regulator